MDLDWGNFMSFIDRSQADNSRGFPSGKPSPWIAKPLNYFTMEQMWKHMAQPPPVNRLIGASIRPYVKYMQTKPRFYAVDWTSRGV